MLEIAIIATLIVATVAVSCALASRRLHPRVIYSTEPDRPKAFGYRMAWLAIESRDSARIIAHLGLEDTFSTNWNNGIGSVYAQDADDAAVFVSPPVNGWTFVVGLALPLPLGGGFADHAMPFLVELGREFPEVQFYVAYPDLDAFAWTRIVGGRVVRAYAINDAGVIWNRGKPGKDEKALGTRLFEPRGTMRTPGNVPQPVLHPTEQHVMEIAATWSLDPTRLESLVALPGLGTLGTAPARWRPQRLRRTG